MALTLFFFCKIAFEGRANHNFTIMFWFKKRFFILSAMAFLFLTSLDVMAQESQWSMRGYIDPIHSIVKGGSNSFGIGVNANYNLHPYVSAGLGLGITEDWKFKANPMIPLFIDVNVDDRSKDFSPTFEFQTGVAFSTTKIDYSVYFINPMVGIRFKQFGLGFGYYGCITMGVDNAKWMNGINLRLAYYFNTNHSKQSSDRLIAYLKRTRVTMDFTLGIPNKNDWTYHEMYWGDDYIHFEESFTIGINAAWLFPLSNHFYIGPTLGFRANPSDDSYSYMDIAARARYEFSQFKLFDKLYGWLQFDLGGIVNTCANGYKASGVFVQPMIGASYELRDGASALELGLGYNAVKVTTDDFEFEHKSKNYFDISLGYRF